MSRIAKLLATVFGRPNLINSGVDYANWDVGGAGTTKGASGIHLVQDGSADRAEIVISGVKPNTLYTLVLNCAAHNLDALFAFAAVYATSATSASVTMSPSVGRMTCVFTTVANVSVAKNLYLVASSANSNGRYIDFNDVQVYEGVV